MTKLYYFDGETRHTINTPTDIRDLRLVDFINDINDGDTKCALYMLDGSIIRADVLDQDDNYDEPSLKLA